MDIKPQLLIATRQLSDAIHLLDEVASRFPPHSETRARIMGQTAKLNASWHELQRLLIAED